MINRVVLVGRLTKDPELRYLQSGVAMCRFTLAVNRPFSNTQGEKEADFISCIAFRKQAENLANYMRKGNLIGLEGRIQTGSYEGQDGKRVYTTDVVADSIQFLESKSSGNAQQQNNTGYQQPPQQQYQQPPQQQYGNQPPQYGSQQQYGGPQQFGGQYQQQVSDKDLPF